MKYRFAFASKRGTFDLSWEPKAPEPAKTADPPKIPEQKSEPPRGTTGTHHARTHTTHHLGFSTPATDRRRRLT